MMEKTIVRLDGEAREVEIAETSFLDGGSLAILAVMRDITERKQAERERERSREELQRLSASLRAVREEEKARIARELHDELGQLLTGLKMDLAQIFEALTPAQTHAMQRAEAMRTLLESTVAAVRRVATELRPLMLDDLGLVPTIDWLANDFSRRTGVAVELKLPGVEFHVPHDLATALFRVTQESLTNVARNSGASRVAVKLSSLPDTIELRIEDNGKGIDEAADGRKTMGLLGMRERATMLGGEFSVDSKAGQGTRIAMSVPRPSRVGGHGWSPSWLPRTMRSSATD